MKKRYHLFIFLLALTLFNCSDDDDPILSHENKIISFKISVDGQTFNGQINHSTKIINVETIGLEFSTSIVPEIEISPNSTISPGTSVTQDFNHEVHYIVKAQNGEVANYVIVANNTILLSKDKKILDFSFEYDNNVFTGVINHDELTIDVETTVGVNNRIPSITISEGATISPGANQAQNFHLPVTYTVTAEDGTSNEYVVTPKICEFSPRFYNFYSNAAPIIGGYNIDLTVPGSALVLENDANSYILTYSDYNVNTSDWIVGVSGNFRIHFPENIVSASNYKLRYKVNNEIKAEANRDVDILAENLPVITSSNQSIYKRNDTLILYGSNLVTGLMVDAYNGSDYIYNQSYISINTEMTELTFPMTINPGMFPTYAGISENYPTRVLIYYNGREGDEITVEFD
jgi:hypothetical protein